MLHITDIIKGKPFLSFPCLSPFLFLPFLPPNSNIFNAQIVSHLLPLCAPHSFISLCLAHSLSFHLILFLSFHLFLSRTLLLSLSFCLFLSLHLSLSHSFILSISHPLFPTRFPSPSLSFAPLFLTHSVGTSSLSLPNLPNARIRWAAEILAFQIPLNYRLVSSFSLLPSNPAWKEIQSESIEKN